MPIKRLFHSEKEQAIFDYVRKHPNCVVSEIIASIYADDPNGGPETGNIISVWLNRMKPKLRANGLEITCTGGRGATYRLRTLEHA